MSSRVRDRMTRALGELRHEPTEKRVRALVGHRTVVDSTRAVLVWEPRRVVPSYAVPHGDLRAELVPGPVASGDAAAPILHPGIPFGVHSTEGEAFGVRSAGVTRYDAAFRPADRDLAGYVVLDFDAFDAWYEEDERVIAHARDPFHRVDVLHASRHVRVELDGELLAESSRPVLVFETGLPLRFYLPPEDVRLPLRPSDRRTLCAYKGEASYWSLDAGGRPREDLAWSYEHPLREASALSGLIAFFDERVDVVVDGQRRERPRTAVSAAILEEAGVPA